MSGGCFYSLILFIPEGVKTSAAVKKSCISKERIYSHCKEIDIIKDQLIDELIEQCIRNHFHNILRLFDVLPNLLFTTS